MSDWQPKETVPRNEQSFEAWLKDGRVVVARWWTREQLAEADGGDPEEWDPGFYASDDEPVEPEKWRRLGHGAGA